MGIVKVKLFELVIAQGVLRELSQQKFSASVSYRLMCLMDEVEPHIRAFHRVRDDAIRRYGKADKDDPDTYRVTPDNQDVFNQEMRELADTEIELSGVEPIRLEWLERTELSPEEIRQLRCLIDEPILEQSPQP